MHTHEEKPVNLVLNHHLNDVMRIICGHEFNTPMATILGLSEMMRTDRGEMTNKELDDYFLYILGSSKRLNNVSKRLGIWYSLTNNLSLQLKPFTIEFQELLLMIDQINELFPGNTIENEVVISGRLNTLNLYGDKSMFVRSFIELLHNAIKFSNTGLPVYIEFAELSDQSYIRVLNNSSMITAGELAEYRVFTQFNRKRYEQQGLGIGIEIARLAAAYCQCTCLVTGKQHDQFCQVVASLNIPHTISDFT